MPSFDALVGFDAEIGFDGGDLSTLVTRLAARLNVTTSDPLYDSLDEYVNEAIHYLETTAPEGYPWYRQRVSLTTTAGTQAYTFTDLGNLCTPISYVTKILDCSVLIESTVLDTLDLINWETADLNYGSTTRDTPRAWLAEGQSLYLFPTPDLAYTVKVRLVVMENDLYGSSSQLLLPPVFHTAIIDAAMLIAYQDLQDVNRIDQQQKRVDQWVTRMQRYGTEYASAPRITVRDPLYI